MSQERAQKENKKKAGIVQAFRQTISICSDIPIQKICWKQVMKYKVDIVHIFNDFTQPFSLLSYENWEQMQIVQFFFSLSF